MGIPNQKVTIAEIWKTLKTKGLAGNRSSFRATTVPEKNVLGRKGLCVNPYPRSTYAAMTTYMDKKVGEVLALLEELKLVDNTLIIFTSDNGTTFNGGTDPDGQREGRKRGPAKKPIWRLRTRPLRSGLMPLYKKNTRLLAVCSIDYTSRRIFDDSSVRM
ncbi:sulfatase-like hydrolase/transferase [Larkinella rosea]|uniref:sulfatase-like hydrolase/transferase n=1 Tax=Larkinella rosea TaxID=2025312 RepID=UPI001E3AA02F|nr:sulfatase-like hydrolase/transferase [Larkinella rosea]